MPVSNELLEYQKEDGELRKIEKELAESEEHKKYVQARKFMKAAVDRLTSLDNRAGELLRLREEIAARIEETTKSLAEYADVDEMLEGGGDAGFYKKSAQALLDRLRAVKQELQKSVKEIEAVTAEYKKLMEQGKLMNRQYRDYKEKSDALEASRAEEVKAIKAKMDALAEKIDPVVLDIYRNKRKEKIFPVVVPLNGDFCVCGRDFPLAQRGALAGGNMVECENCHRLVYRR